MVINPVVLDFGSWQIHLFTASIVLAAAAGIGWLCWTARRLGDSPLRWLDAAVGLVLGGLVGARMFHVWLAWSYFSTQPDQITMLSNGGFDWHGALLGGLLGGGVIGLVRHVPWRAFSDALAVSFPIATIAAWGACGQSACAYGQPVRTLADYPRWLAIESPDVFGQVEPRFNLPQIGVWFGLILLIGAAIITWRRWFTGQRLWVLIGVFSLGQAALDQFRGDDVPNWFGHRADQVLDMVIIVLAFIVIVINRWMSTHNNKGQSYEGDDRIGADLSQNRGRGREPG